jgi:hypothetical protein
MIQQLQKITHLADLDRHRTYTTITQPVKSCAGNWEETSQCAPFGSHIGNSQSFVHAQCIHTFSGEFDRMIQHLVFVEQTAQCDNNIFSRHARQ